MHDSVCAASTTSFLTTMSEDLREGATATIEGLVSRADLNGKLVKLLKFSDGRWGTRLLDDTENVRVNG